MQLGRLFHGDALSPPARAGGAVGKSVHLAYPLMRLYLSRSCSGGRDDGDEIAGERLSVRAFGFALVVTLELAALLNRPHSSPTSDLRP